MLAYLVDIDGVRFSEDLKLGARDFAGTANGKARAGERVTPNERGGQAQFAPQRAHFVFEKRTQRFNQFEAHFFRQTANVVVALDRDGRPARKAHAFNDIGIERALGKELGTVDLVCVFLEHVNKEPTNDLPLGFRVAHTVKFTQKELGLFGVDDGQVHVVAEHTDDLFCLVLAQQAVVNKNAGKLVADGLVDQSRRDRAVDTTRQRTDDLGVAHLSLDICDSFVAVGAHRPIAREPGQSDEVFIELFAIWRVVHFGVELNRVKVAGCIGCDGIRRVGRGAVDGKTGGELGHVIAVAHPDLFFVVCKPAVQQWQLFFGWCDVGPTEFRRATAARDFAAMHFAAQLLHHHLLAIANAQNRHAIVEHALRRAGRAGSHHAVGPAGKNDGFGRDLVDHIHRHGLVRADFAVNVQLAQPARDQLRHLAAEIDDQKTVMAHETALCRRWRRCKAWPALGGRWVVRNVGCVGRRMSGCVSLFHAKCRIPPGDGGGTHLQRCNTIYGGVHGGSSDQTAGTRRRRRSASG